MGSLHLQSNESGAADAPTLRALQQPLSTGRAVVRVLQQTMQPAPKMTAMQEHCHSDRYEHTDDVVAMNAPTLRLRNDEDDWTLEAVRDQDPGRTGQPDADGDESPSIVAHSPFSSGRDLIRRS